MQVGTQSSGTVAAGATQRWYTFGWPQTSHVVWYVVPTTPQAGAPEIEWDVEVERTSEADVTYWITVRNLTAIDVNVDLRYAILN